MKHIVDTLLTAFWAVLCFIQGDGTLSLWEAGTSIALGALVSSWELGYWRFGTLARGIAYYATRGSQSL